MAIFLGSTQVTKIFLGSIENPKIYMRDFLTFPPQSTGGTVTSAITSVGRYYSSGSAINAAGSNYAYIQGVQIWYTDGVETRRNNIVLTPSFTENTIWYKEGNNIRAYTRGSTTGATRSISVMGTYQGHNYGTFTVQQTANTMTYAAGAITSFALNGNSARTQTFDSSAVTLYVSSLSGYRRAIYDSGIIMQAQAQLALRKNDDNTWATINGTSSISIPANTGGTSRSVTITAYDQGYYPTVASSITITQYAAAQWVLNVPTGITIGYDVTEFTITGITSTRNGSPFDIYQSMISFSPADDSILATDINSLGGGQYAITFTIDENTGTSVVWKYITIAQPGGKSATCRVTQNPNEESITGITIYNTSGDWVLGTITVGSGTSQGYGSYETRAIIVAKRTPIEGGADVSISQFAWQWAPPVAGQSPYSYSESMVSFRVEAGSTLTLRPLGDTEFHTYYGAYVVSNNEGTITPKPNVQINYTSGFSVQEY